jgi:hypothetical protein
MCRVRSPAKGTRPDQSPPAHSRHKTIADSLELAAIMEGLALVSNCLVGDLTPDR